MSENKNRYDVFVSYARSDDQGRQWIPKLVKSLETVFRSLTGRSLSVFLDNRTIDTAQIWQERIREALEGSQVMLAVLSPSYFTSTWCGWEWDHFVEAEKANRERLGLGRGQGLVFPIRIIDWSSVLRPTSEEQRRMAEAEARQWIDFQELEPGTKDFDARVRELVQDIIPVLAQLDREVTRVTASTDTPPPPAQARTAETKTHPSIRLGTDNERFIQLLSEATHAIILGFTNQNLVSYLSEALSRKQAREGKDAFWHSLRIIFLSEVMLSHVNDELAEEFPDAETANLRRLRMTGQAKRALSYFLIRANHPNQWNLYEYNYMLPFVGAAFELKDGQKIVQIATPRPGCSMAEYLFYEFSGAASEITYYQAAFEDVVRKSRKQDEIVLIGSPQSEQGEGFIVHHARFRRSVLMPVPGSSDWLAAVVIMLWSEENGKAFPLLQIRTSENATRELDMLSNISGYINQQDCREFDAGMTSEFLLQESAYENAVYRELTEELGVGKEHRWPKPELVRQIKFYYPDRENLYFFLCRVKSNIPLHRVQASTRLQKRSFAEIIRTREYQVLAKAQELLSFEESRGRPLELATRVVADNLILHRQEDLGGRLMRTLDTAPDYDGLKRAIGDEMTRRRLYYDFYTQRRPILGVAGLQYREFFTTLVPAYAEIGVEGAEEYLAWIRASLDARAALERLSQHYQDPLAIREAELDV